MPETAQQKRLGDAVCCLCGVSGSHQAVYGADCGVRGQSRDDVCSKRARRTGHNLVLSVALHTVVWRCIKTYN